MSLRDATPADAAAIRRVHEEAFGRAAEADLVEALTASGEVVASLVAPDDDDTAAGHLLLSRAEVSDGTPVLVLGPVGVLPAAQGRGAGRELTRAALARARETDLPLLVVLGSPAFYSKLGFEPCSRLGVRPPDRTWPPEAFRALRLPSWREGISGRLRYPAPWSAV